MSRGAWLGTAALLAVALASMPAAAHDPLKIVTFGTSLTARGGWQATLGEKLGACLERPVEVDTVALSGSTTEWALTQTDKVAALKPDIVLVEFYANDAALDRLITLGGSRENIGKILDALRAGAPKARIVSMTMNPISGLRGWIRPRLSAFVAAHREAAAERGIETVDFGPLWEALPPDELAAAIPDGAHPLPEAARRIIVPELVRRLGGCDAPGSTSTSGDGQP